MKPLIEEIIKGKSERAFYITVIGQGYRALFDKVSLPNYRVYCERHELGLLLLNSYHLDDVNL